MFNLNENIEFASGGIETKNENIKFASGRIDAKHFAIEYHRNISQSRTLQPPPWNQTLVLDALVLMVDMVGMVFLEVVDMVGMVALKVVDV